MIPQSPPLNQNFNTSLNQTHSPREERIRSAGEEKRAGTDWESGQVLKELGTFRFWGSVARSAVRIRSGTRELSQPVGYALESSEDSLRCRKAQCPRAVAVGTWMPQAPFEGPRRQNFAQPGDRQGPIPLPLRTPGLVGFVSKGAERRLGGGGIARKY